MSWIASRALFSMFSDRSGSAEIAGVPPLAPAGAVLLLDPMRSSMLYAGFSCEPPRYDHR